MASYGHTFVARNIDYRRPLKLNWDVSGTSGGTTPYTYNITEAMLKDHGAFEFQFAAPTPAATSATVAINFPNEGSSSAYKAIIVPYSTGAAQEGGAEHIDIRRVANGQYLVTRASAADPAANLSGNVRLMIWVTVNTDASQQGV